MKKTISAFFALVLCLSLCACGGETNPEKMSPKEAVVDCAEWEVAFALTYQYGCTAANAQVTTIEETGENEFDFYGTYSAKDAYNQSVKGKFEGTGKYNPDTEKASVDLEMN